MKRWGITILGAMLLTMSAGTTAADDAAAKAPNGKPIFTKYKCRACHAIEAQGITKKAEAGEVEETTEKKPPDLSGVGIKRKADWIMAFLLKKEMVNGKKHEKKFRGTEGELKTLAGWLESLKDGKAAAKMEQNEKANEKAKATE